MRYGELIKRAARITWRNKSLWPFGIALALFSGGAASGNHGNGLQYTFGRQDLSRMGHWVPRNWEQIATAALAMAVVVGILAIIMSVVGIVVRNTSLGALIGMTVEAEKDGDVSFRSGLRQGWKALLHLFLINLVVGIAAALATFVFVILVVALAALVALPAVPMFRAGNGWTVAGVAWVALFGVLLITITILAAIALGGAISLIREYALRSATLENAKVFDALGHGIALLKANLRQSAWMWIMLGLLQMALGAVLVPVGMAVGFATLIPAVALWRATESVVLPALIATPIVLVGGVLLVAIEGLFLTFQSVTWTLVYRELRPEVEA